ncbi:MAG: septum formation protein Maf [Desulfobacterales bacterium]|nr:septum formation protein Maf [Desulfobacterales bacterium]
MPHHPISKDNPLVLASISPRRKAILEHISIPFEAVGSMVEETLVEGMQPAEIACRTALRKAQSVQHNHKSRWILGADTIVVMNRRVFGKPGDSRECHDMLLHLSGRNHKVITGFCIVDPGGETVHVQAVMTKVKIKRISETEIEAYIKTREPFGKAGGYAIQGIGSFMIEHITGSYTNVVGLPVCEVVSALLACGGLKGFPLIEK